MKILIVDDAIVFRSQIKAALDGVAGISIAGVAANGRIGLERLSQLDCDVVILDMEMPEMNGLEMLDEMRKRGHTQKVVVFAAPTKDGAHQALEALAAGAVDFIAKPHGVSSLEEALDGIKRELVPKILQFAKREGNHGPSVYKESLAAPRADQAQNALSPYPHISLRTLRPRIVVIGSSTGGPVALEKLMAVLKGHRLLVPIMIVQHMPPHFTDCLARRLEAICGIPAAEGKQGEAVSSGRIYVAPGDYHMSIRRDTNGMPLIQLDLSPKRNFVRPAVDTLFESAALHYRDGVAGFVLTGMGEDGKAGAQAIKLASGGIMIQDLESSVVWGMPGAVHAAKAFDLMGDIGACGEILLRMVT